MANPASLRKIAYSPAPFSTWLGVVLLFILFGLIVLAVIGPSPRGSDYEQTRAKKRMESLKALREENEKELTTYAWVDKNKGVARIPIDRAMELDCRPSLPKKSRRQRVQWPPSSTAVALQGAAVSSSLRRSASRCSVAVSRRLLYPTSPPAPRLHRFVSRSMNATEIPLKEPAVASAAGDMEQLDAPISMRQRVCQC